MSRIITALLCITLLLAPALSVAVMGETTVSGIVTTLDDGTAARLGNAELTFDSAQGATVVASDNLGRYHASLQPNVRYTVTVTARGFCPVHRPSFRLDSGSHVKFDFTLTMMCPGDRIVVGKPELYFDSLRRYYFEESLEVPSGVSQKALISFGTRKRAGHRLLYSALPVRDDKDLEIPVTLAFDVYTITAHRIVFDEDQKTFRAEENVLISDGTSSAEHPAECRILLFDQQGMRILQCDGQQR